MNVAKNLKYFTVIVFFAVFILSRILYNVSTNAITPVDLEGLGLSSAAFPFGIIKETALNSYFSPCYYLLIHFFNTIFHNILLLRIINAIIALLTIGVVFLIGKTLKGNSLGLFFAFYLAVNRFYLFYTNQLSPYCFNFLLISILLYFLICFLKSPSKIILYCLCALNAALILSDSFGFVFVGCELLVFYLISERAKHLKQSTIKLFKFSLIAFLIASVVLLIQFYHCVKSVIPANFEGIGLNFNSFYLLLSEYLSPFLSFDVPDFQSKSTLGMLYSYFFNRNFQFLNSLKLLITLFYSSLLPIGLIIYFGYKTIFKNRIFKILFYILGLNFILMLVLMLYQIIDVKPVYIYPFFFGCLIFLGFGLFQLKDRIIRIIIICCLFLIQIIQPNISSFDIVLNKQYPAVNALNQFIKEYQISPSDLILMPYKGKYAKMYYKGLSFAGFDYDDLKLNSKNSLVQGLITKQDKKINKYNIHYLTDDYLQNAAPSDFVRDFFYNVCFADSSKYQRIILFVDKLNSKPFDRSQILSVANNVNYSTDLKKINYKNTLIYQNETKNFYNALKSKFLYDLIFCLEEKFILNNIAEYKKIASKYYKVDSKAPLRDVIINNNSDYAFFIFKKQ